MDLVAEFEAEHALSNGTTPMPVLQPTESPKHKPTDDEIGESIMKDWDGNMRFFFAQWHRYENGAWKAVSRLDTQIWDKLKTLKNVGIRPSHNKVSGIEKYLQSYLWTDDELIDRDNQYINLQNGLFNLDTGKLEPHKRDFYATSQLPFAFDEEADCPEFQRFLNTVLVHNGKPDYDLQKLVLEAMGYSMTSNTDFRVSFWLQGESNTGKSVLINLLQELAGNSHTPIDLDMMSQNPYQIADIAGKRLVTFTEPKANGVLPDNHYKRLVSQDAITARQIYGKPFRFVPICKVWGAMNEFPRVVDRSDAIFNRVIVIPMNHVIPLEDRDPQLNEKLQGELAGIFNLVLSGLYRLRRAKRFTKSVQSENARTDYKAENDIESAFISECCIRDIESSINAQLLYDSYATWCKRNGAFSKSSVKVAKDWHRLGFTKERRNHGFIYRGLMLNAEYL